jgi:peptide/nickel transport system ATP-binding protein
MAASEQSPVLSVSNLTIATVRSSRSILDKVSFSIQPHEIVGIFAESGGGKTILSRYLSGSLSAGLEVLSGEALFKGVNFLDGPSSKGIGHNHNGREIAFIGGNPQASLDPTIPVGLQLVEKLQAVKPDLSPAQAKERILSLLDEVRIPSPGNRFYEYPSQFSGGMMQRAMIVDALCSDPVLIVADNITRPLDVTVAQQIVNLLRKMCELHGVAALVLSSSPATLLKLADRLLVFQNGSIVEHGPVAEVLKSPQHAYTRHIVASTPRIWNLETELALPEAKPGAPDILQAANLRKFYPVRRYGVTQKGVFVQAVRAVTFSVKAGESIGIVGESGCGKSTLTRILAALESTDQGHLELLGHDITKLAAQDLKKLRCAFQLLLQDPYTALPPRMSVGRMIEEGLRIHGLGAATQRRSAVREAMVDVGLDPELENALPLGLSTGQMQRVAIARALVLQPKLMILDESLSALDQMEQGRMLALFTRLQRERELTYIFISHDLAMVRRVCGRIAVMYLGEIIEVGSNDSIFEQPRHPYTQALLSAAPTLEKIPAAVRAAIVDGEPPNPIDIPVGCSFASRCPRSMHICREIAPELVQISANVQVACHAVSGHGAALGSAQTHPFDGTDRTP